MSTIADYACGLITRIKISVMRNYLGKGMMHTGFIIGAINYLFTAGYFFSNDMTGLGLIQLFVPPAEVVLPWVASPTLGLVSLVSLSFIIVGAAIAVE